MRVDGGGGVYVCCKNVYVCVPEFLSMCVFKAPDINVYVL